MHAGKATDGLLDKISELRDERDKALNSLAAVVALAEMYPKTIPTHLIALAIEEHLS